MPTSPVQIDDVSAKPVRVGIVGTSWWTDSMYLPALAHHGEGSVVALCGRNRDRADQLAKRWGVPHVFTDWRQMLDSGLIDAVIVAATNDLHYPVSIAAIEAGMAVLCEKPLALDVVEADAMAAAAASSGVVTMTPFTYRWMPTFATTKAALDAQMVGRPYHFTMRYLGQYGRDLSPVWRFDPDQPGAGVIADLGSHVLYLAEWLNGPITELGAVVATHRDPDRGSFAAEDTAYLTCRFANGSIGVLQACAMAWAGTSMGQTHHLDIHGSAGRLTAYNDWDTVQRVNFVADGAADPGIELPLTDEAGRPLDESVRLDSVHNTYRDIFRSTNAMTRAWVTSIATGTHCRPDFADGARVQHLIDAALTSVANDGQMGRV